MAREMTNSTKPWIGEIPSHWELKRIKNIIQPSKDGIKIGPFGSALTNKTIGEGEYNVYSQANLIASDFSSTKNTIDSDTFEELKNYEVFPDDICLSMMGTIGKCKKVPAGIRRGIMDSHLIKIRLSESVDSRFFEYVYDKDYGGVCFAQMQYDKKGFIMDGLNTSIVKNLYFPLPPIDEQVLIANYLDFECARIDVVMEQTRASIEEYKKLKQSIITEAVTKGIRPNRPMKDSGIDWIGQIPDDWGMPKMNSVCSVITDYVASGSFASLAENVEYLDEPDYAMLIRTADISEKGYAPKPVYISKHAYDFLKNSNLFGGELMLPNIGASVGDIYIVPKLYERMSLAPNAIMVKTRYVDRFYYYYFLGKPGRLSIEDIAQSTAQAKFNKTDFRQLRVPLPSKEEQLEIAAYLDEKTMKVDALIAKKEKFLAEMESYKKSLIFEYVTGKRSVNA